MDVGGRLRLALRSLHWHSTGLVLALGGPLDVFLAALLGVYLVPNDSIV
jgi:hypothetical protein